MANTKEIQTRMHSIQDTMKITRAMYMISSAKLKKARKTLENAEKHYHAMRESIAKILRNVPEVKNFYFGHEKPEKDKKVAYLVITADKGLAGAYNQNVIKLVQKELLEKPEARLFVVGQIGRNYFDKKGFDISKHFQYTAQNPSIHRARVISEEMLVRYNQEKLDEIYLVYTKSGKGIESEAAIMKLLPLEKDSFETGSYGQTTTCYLPSPSAVMDSLVPNYITGIIYGTLVEAYACEQNDRMMAMDAATGNATDMLKKLSVEYNRVRQAAITQEITEVIAGAKAQKRKKANGER